MKPWHAAAQRLRAEEGCTYAEIGARLGRSRSSVEYALSARPNGQEASVERERRRVAVLALRRLGWAKRRVAAALAISDSTVRADLAAAGEPELEHAVGRDGRHVPGPRRAAR